VASAVRASIAVPGVVQPLCLNDKILVDGAVTDRVPAEIVKKMEADIVIAVDLQYYPKEKVNIENIYDVILQSIEILERQVRDKYKKYADIIVKPRVSTYTWTNFEVAADFIELGFSPQGKNLLKKMKDKSSLPIITKFASAYKFLDNINKNPLKNPAKIAAAGVTSVFGTK